MVPKKGLPDYQTKNGRAQMCQHPIQFELKPLYMSVLVNISVHTHTQCIHTYMLWMSTRLKPGDSRRMQLLTKLGTALSENSLVQI